MKWSLILLWTLLTGQVSRAADAENREKNDLIKGAPVIAVVEITNAPPPRIYDASLHAEVFKQRAEAKTQRIIKGTLPSAFTIENERDSVLTNGRHLAFLRPLSERRFILSSPISLRRIEGTKAFWFPNEYVDIDQIVAQIQGAGG